MYIHSVKLINYKSIGDYAESEIILEPKVTTIIGKNESGKSNVLDGLSHINLLTGDNSAFNASIVNRNCDTGTENYFVVTLKSSPEEMGVGIDTTSQVIIKKGVQIATGGILELYASTVATCTNKIVEYLKGIGANPFNLNGQDFQGYTNHCIELTRTDYIDVPKINSALKSMRARCPKLVSPKREEFEEIVDSATLAFNAILIKLPSAFYRQADKHLNSTYKLEDIEKELKNKTINPNSLLREFVEVIGISVDDFINASKSGITSVQTSIRSKINRYIDKYINKEFKKFYTNEHIHLSIDFNTNMISFSVQSEDGETLTLSERSNGLRWYLETFIDAKAHDVKDKNVVYLFDEPGIYLHVNAQKELIQLFNHLADKGNQVVYTTHSPQMLDTENNGVHRIRAVVKDRDGYTKVYKTAYDPQIAPDSQEDTLATIIRALGMSLNDEFGPSHDKVNIVTEGMSDYIFITLMAKVLDVNMSNYAIIPSVGATNCVKICSILHGWGCKYKAIFDYDKEGVESGGEYMRNNMLFELGEQYSYLKDVTQDDINAKTYRTTAERCEIEDIVTRDELERFCSSNMVGLNTNKTLKAKLYSNAVEDGSFEVGVACKQNFTELFGRIFG